MMWFRSLWPCVYNGGFGACVAELLMCSNAVDDDVVPRGVGMPDRTLPVVTGTFCFHLACLTQQ